MNRIRLSGIATAFVALSVTASAGAPAESDLARVDEFVRAEMKRQKVPGVAVAVIRNGSVTLEKGYGDANVEHGVPVTPDTIFQSGSLGKQFTAAAVMVLVDDGRIALSDSATRFFPDAPSRWRQITVRHLLTHTSGLPDYTRGTIDYRRDYTEDELVKLAYALKLEFAPGSRWNYSNTGYLVLGALIRKASGQFYGDLLRQRVFEPLGMTTARIITEDEIVPHRAAGYRLASGELRNQEWVAPTINTTADGSLYLSLRDMIAWERGLREKRILKPESWSQVFTPVRLKSGKTYPYGFGWGFEDVTGHRLQRHGGGWQGFRTDIARYTDDDLTIIVLANLAEADPAGMSDGIAVLLDPRLKRAELTPVGDVPTIQSRARKILDDATAGRLAPSEFGYLRAGFFPDGAKRYADMLRGAGPVTALTLLENRELGDDQIYTYDVLCAKATLRLRLGIAPDGKISVFASRSASSRP